MMVNLPIRQLRKHLTFLIQVTKLLALFFICESIAHAEFNNSALEQKVGSSKYSTHSILFTRIQDGKILFEKNADQLVSPASVTKLITSLTALRKYGPATTIKTNFSSNGKVLNGRLNGDLIVTGIGDPFVVSEKLWQLAADFKNMNIREITGNLVLDLSYFDDEARDQSRKEGESVSSHAYDAPVSPFGINFNTVAVNIYPNAKGSGPALVTLDPYPLSHVKLVNRVATGASTSVNVTRGGSESQNVTLTVTGTIARDASMKKIYRSVSNHVMLSGEYLKTFLKEAGVTVRGKVITGKTPTNAKVIYELEGYDLRKIVQGLNNFSNNFIADVLTKKLGADFAGAPGTFAKGVNVISNFLKEEVGIKTEFHLLNGSGLDTSNRLSARQIVQALLFAEKHGEIFPDFFASLPAYGWDGTVKKRGKNDSALEGVIRSKTGTLSDPISVAGVAGYFRHPREGLVAFCFISNGLQGKPQPGVLPLRELQDSFLNELF